MDPAPPDGSGQSEAGKGRSPRGDGATGAAGGSAVPEGEPPGEPAPEPQPEPDGWLKAFLAPAVPDVPPEAAEPGDGGSAADLSEGRDGTGVPHRRHTRPLVVATIAGIASILLGAGYFLWRNRPSRFWPA